MADENNLYSRLRASVPGFQDLSDDDLADQLWRRGFGPNYNNKDEFKNALTTGIPKPQEETPISDLMDPSKENTDGSFVKGALDRLNAFGVGASNALSLGQDRKIIPAMQNITSGVMPWSDSWDESYSRNQALNDRFENKTSDNYPIFYTGGQVAGTAVGAGKLPAVAPWTGAGKVATAATQAAEFGALDRGVRSASDGDSLPDVARNAAWGAAEGAGSAALAGGLLAGAGRLGGTVANSLGDAQLLLADVLKDAPKKLAQSKLSRSVFGEGLSTKVFDMDKNFYNKMIDKGLDVEAAGNILKNDLLNTSTRWNAYRSLIDTMRAAPETFEQTDLRKLPLMLKATTRGSGELTGSAKNISNTFDDIWNRMTPEQKKETFKNYFGNRATDQLDVAAMRSKLASRAINGLDKGNLSAQTGSEIREVLKANRDYPKVEARYKELSAKPSPTADELQEMSKLEKTLTAYSGMLKSQNVNRGIPGSISSYYDHYFPGQVAPRIKGSKEIIDVPLEGWAKAQSWLHDSMGGGAGKVVNTAGAFPFAFGTGAPLPPLMAAQLGARVTGHVTKGIGDAVEALTNPEQLGTALAKATAATARAGKGVAMRLARQPEQTIADIKNWNPQIATQLESAFTRGPDVYRAAVYKLMQDPATRSQIESRYGE